MRNAFHFIVPTDITFGSGAELQVGPKAASYGFHKALIHYGGGSAVKSGLVARVKASLEEAGLACVELGGVQPNPRVTLVREGIELCKNEGVDVLIAVGGGSVIDSCKAIGVGLANGGDVWDFFCRKRTVEKFFPLGVVLTIAAAGSETSDSCVISNEELAMKHGINYDIIRPLFALCDPDLTLTVSPYQTACGCTDIFMHTMERYFTARQTFELTDGISEAVMRSIIDSARKLALDPGDADARAEMMWAGTVSHCGLTGCGNGGNDFVCHGLEHEISARYDVAHGAGLAAVWGSWARYVLPGIPQRFVSFAKNVLGMEMSGTPEETGLKAIEAMEAFFREIGMPTSIRGLGIELTDGDIDILTEGYGIATNGGKGAARFIGKEDARAIYRMAK